MLGNGGGDLARLTLVGTYLRLTITDTPRRPPVGPFGVDPISRATRTVWCHLPADWVADGALRPCRRELLLADQMIARHVVLAVEERLLSEREARDRPWLGDRAAFCRYGPDGAGRPVTAGEL
nr:hypothetical protein [Micromonospora sp. DSM 115978]